MRKLSLPLFGVLALTGLAVGGPTYALVNYVTLQTTSPGTAEAGHINITGNAVASTVRVDGANVNSGGLTPGLKFGSIYTGEGIFSDRSGSGVNNHGLDFAAGTGPRMSITNGGKVGIGTRTPTESLSVVGNGSFSGNLSAANMPAVKIVDANPAQYVPTNDYSSYQAFSTTFTVPADGYLDVTAYLTVAFQGTLSSPHETKSIAYYITDNGSLKLSGSYSIAALYFGGRISDSNVWAVTAGTHTLVLSYNRVVGNHSLLMNDARGIIRYTPKGL